MKTIHLFACSLLLAGAFALTGCESDPEAQYEGVEVVPESSSEALRGSPACPLPNNCNALLALFNMENGYVRGCSADSECGQVLTGTSCGCTRNWVARNDVDVSCWRQLKDKGQAMGCPGFFFISTCDCPPADGFACVDGTCNWNYTGRPIFPLQ